MLSFCKGEGMNFFILMEKKTHKDKIQSSCNTSLKVIPCVE